MVEHVTFNHGVAGSNPAWLTNSEVIMTLDQHIEVQERLEKLSIYYKNIDFPNLSKTCGEAAESIKALAEALKEYEAKMGSIDNPPIGEEASETV